MITPAGGGEPVSPDVHTRWVRDTEKRIRQMEQQGFVKAEESDVRADHDGWKTTEGVIRNGDLILMKAQRERVEAKKQTVDQFNAAREQARLNEANRIRDDAGTDTLETRPGHGQRRGSGKTISIP